MSSQRPYGDRMTSRRPAITVSVIGVLAVVLYATLGAVQILVLNPLAAVPGKSIAEIRAGMSEAGEVIDTGMVLGIFGLGVLIALGVAALAIKDAAPARLTVLLYCAVLVMGAPAYFIASFGPGMSLADAYGISGGDYSPWARPLYVASLFALGTAITLAVTFAWSPRPAASAPAPAKRT